MRALWLVIPALTLGCDSPAGPNPGPLEAVQTDLGEPFQLRVGERAVIETADLDVRFQEVSSDSRCPSHALILCVWEGDASITIETSPQDADAMHHTLHTNLEPKSAILGRLRLTLLQLEPYPEDVTPIPVGAYLATLVVESIR